MGKRGNDIFGVCIKATSAYSASTEYMEFLQTLSMGYPGAAIGMHPPIPFCNALLKSDEEMSFLTPD